MKFYKTHVQYHCAYVKNVGGHKLTKMAVVFLKGMKYSFSIIFDDLYPFKTETQMQIPISNITCIEKNIPISN